MSSFANIHNREQLDAKLDEPDILVGARVDRNIATLDEISDFIRRVASARQQMLYGAVPEVRHRCDVDVGMPAERARSSRSSGRGASADAASDSRAEASRR